MKQLKKITLKEYETTLSGYLNAQDILEVEKLNNLSKTEIFEIKSNNRIRAKQYVGIVKINNKNIQILPKIFGKEKNAILKNLLYMLSYTKKLKIRESDIANLGKINDLFEVFIYIFSKELLALLKKDYKKNYNIIEKNSSFLKGKLLFSKHLQQNLFNKSRFFIEYEKMDENFLLNIFLKSTCEKLIKITQSKTNSKLLNRCNFILKDIDSKDFVSPKILDTIDFHRQNKAYEHIVSLGKMLYFGNSPDFSKNLENNFSLLFDMNVLFEEFIAEFMKKNKDALDPNIHHISSQVANKYVFLNKKFTLKPDIFIHYNNNNILIIDTKYKKLDASKTNNGVSSSDIYQMLAYGMRYFGSYDTQKQKNIILLYPDYDEKNYDTVYKSEENIHIKIKTLNMNVDLASISGKNKLIEEMKNIF